MEKSAKDRKSTSSVEHFDESRFIRKLYRYGSFVAGLALLLGLSAISQTEPEDNGVLLTILKFSLLALWILPVAALLGPGIIKLKRKHTSLSGWLAVIMAIVLMGLWTLV